MNAPAPIAPPPPSGRGRAGAAKSGAPPGEMSFATLLQNDRARTAVAEGPHNEPQRHTSAEHRDDRSDARLERGTLSPAKLGEQPEATPQPGTRTEPQDPAVDPALRSPVPPTPAEPISAPVVATTTPFADAVAEARAAVAAPDGVAQVPGATTAATPTVPAVPGEGGEAVAATPAVPGESGESVAAAPAAPARPATPVVPTTTQDAAAQPGPVEQAKQTAATEQATRTAQPAAEGDDAVAATPAETDAPDTDTDGDTGAAPRPGRGGDAPGQQADHRGTGRPATNGNGNGPVNPNPADPSANADARAFETPSRTGVTPSPVGAARSTLVTEAAAPAPAPAAPATVAAPQTEAAPQASAPAPVRGTTTLQHLARTVDAAMQVGHARGITRAKLHLHPAELGAIELHLRHTANGMTARLVAESPEAVTVLQQASSDLRRSLEQAGITLTSLDIGARADQQAGQRTSAGAFDASNLEGDGNGPDGRGPGRASGDDTDPTLDPTIRARVPLPGGALVDVLA